MKITRCEAHQIEELAALSKQTFIDAFEKVSEPTNFQLYINKAFTPSVIGEELAHPQTAFYLLHTEGGDLIGYAKLRWDRSEEFFTTEKALELQRIYLLEAYWGKGYGQQLLAFCEQYGREHGFDWIWLVVWYKNEGAIRFYQRENWEIFARKDFQFGNEIHNDFVLRKRL